MCVIEGKEKEFQGEKSGQLYEILPKCPVLKKRVHIRCINMEITGGHISETSSRVMKKHFND